ncbi:type II toxin-antitoxin system PemK/MazF family toxin [Solobacterium sp.]|uniref:type II toxin-antitoxin system PemK/MazF family toxin n=1 Tax=Solobacterium sp. TaxID=2060878 RepID=UPI001CAC5884|nr:type II toxin-antitoxin system PemK/MazF family toxin [Solobacterium sp.]MBF1099385.1 type II toxin-antitoxin system PemK/MazF family toxin [Solobacterium sp.]
MAAQITKKQTKYYKYKRGQLIIVRFGERRGTEFSGIHPAIVITKSDNPFCGDITVIPLTSKFHSQCLELGEILNKDVYNMLNNSVTNHLLSNEAVIEIIESCKKNSSDGGKITTEVMAEINNKIFQLNPPGLADDFSKFKQLSEKYEPMLKKSYAVVSQITTISKLKIIKPINEFDPLKKLIVKDSILNKLDEEIIRRFTQNN